MSAARHAVNLPALSAVLFAEDSHDFARAEYDAGRISIGEYALVVDAVAWVRVIAANGTQPVESE